MAQHDSKRQVHELNGQFRKLMKEKSGEGLAKWCEDAEQVGANVGFVRGLRFHRGPDGGSCGSNYNGHKESERPAIVKLLTDNELLNKKIVLDGTWCLGYWMLFTIKGERTWLDSKPINGCCTGYA